MKIKYGERIEFMLSADKVCLPGGELIADIVPYLLKTKCGKSFQYSKTSWTITTIETTERDDGFRTKTYYAIGKPRNKEPNYSLILKICKYGNERTWGIYTYDLNFDFGDIPW